MGRYITTTDLAAEGIAGQDSRLDELIDWAEEWIERATGYRFYEHHAEFKCSGRGVTEVLPLPQAIISIQSVEEDGDALTSTEYVVYNRRPPDEDDRKYPRLIRVVTSDSTNASFDAEGNVTAPWPRGYQNIIVEGQFGYTDSVGGQERAPKEIKRALLRLVACEVARVGVDDEVQAQRIRKYLASFGGGELQMSLSELAQSGGESGIREVDVVVGRFRHPTKAARPAFPFAGA